MVKKVISTCSLQQNSNFFCFHKKNWGKVVEEENGKSL